ncbi:MAG: hypothetical protein PVI87_09535 [Gammaproteobacteria bacterium]|jgi:hypothetical protein
MAGLIYISDPERIALDNWVREVDDSGQPTGLVRRTSFRSADEVGADLDYELRELLAECEAFGTWFQVSGQTITRFQRVIVYATTGANEGHYVYVELVGERDERTVLWSAKTFQGADHAWAIARRAADLLGA